MPELQPSHSAPTPSAGPRARLPRRQSDSASRLHLQHVFSAQHLDDVSDYHDGDHESKHHDADNDTDYSSELEHVRNDDYDEAAREGKDEVAEVRMGIPDTRDLEANLEKKQTTRSIKDPNLVSWDSPDDPENPKNWTFGRKWAATIVVSSFTLISPVSSSMVAPALTSISKEFGITNEVESQLVLSVFVLAYAIGPLFLGPLSEIYGRGPIAGGFITQNTTWRWAFWATSIADGAIQVMGLLFLRETYPPKLLHAKAEKLRKDTGNAALHTEFEHPERTLANTMKRSLIRPFKLLGTQPIVQALAIYMAYLYGLMYLVLSTFPALWEKQYHESIGIGGLNYISLGVGFFLGTQICAPVNDRIYRRLKKRNDNVGRPEFRIPLMIPGSLLVPLGLFIYGWSSQYHTHWIGPNIGAALFAAGVIIGFQCIQTYLVDSYTRFAASAIAAATVLRSLAGFGFPLFAPSMYDALHYGWGNSLLGFIAIGLGVPAPFLLWFFGKKLRERSPFAAGGD
ncbi:MAG: hypothetical protein ASARMPRED_004439 [Alectoria sarmentosa]|nr:MAG: hypothetical protein ASARMPRED_004439 [Alectoria sarmentosa]